MLMMQKKRVIFPGAYIRTVAIIFVPFSFIKSSKQQQILNMKRVELYMVHLLA